MKLPSQKLNVKVIAFDLDDTLLNHDLKISPKTVSAIQKAAEKGIYIVLCSGRAENAILPYVRALDIAGTQQGRYLIGINGASVLDLHMRLPIYSHTLASDILKYVYHEAKKRGMAAVVYDPSTIYAGEDSAWARKDAEMCGLHFKKVDDYEAFLDSPRPKMLVPAEPERISEWQPQLQKELEGRADVFISKPFFLEVMPNGVGKGQAVLWLADYLGIPREQTMAFGDSMNDESMIVQCGYGVAMCNGLEYIKDKADFVTRKSNDEDGIADFLESFVL